jgi:hypothetical protein
VTGRFDAYVAIDWSGAKGSRHKGIAVAEARGGAPPKLVRPNHVWSREEVCQWLLERAAGEPTLFGFDFSFAPPIVERGEYLLGEPDVPKTAREFWAYVDDRCRDEDLGAASFLEQVHRRHFYFGIADGVKADFVRFRQCDAKASFSGMRLLHRLNGRIAIWPIDPLPERGSAVVEIYTRIYLRRAGMAGTKLRTRSDLNRALEGLGSPPARLRFEPNDHQTDALVTAAGMRVLALTEPRAFDPEGLTPEIARSEGWTFGVL